MIRKKQRSIRQRIFQSNTLMVITTLVLFLLVSAMVVKVYSESIEQDLKYYDEGTMQWESGHSPLDLWEEHKRGFLAAFLIDGALCIIVLVLISQFFTKRLADFIMRPMDELSKGAERIRKGDLSQEIAYHGDMEFEKVCGTFNDMQKHILLEQEKNRRYEQARTDMIAGISHDLRTPLTAIRGTIRGLIDGIADTPEKQKVFLETADRRAGEMNALLQQLLDLSRMETGRTVLHPEKVDLRTFLQGYVDERQEDLRDNERLILEAAADSVTVSADPEQLWRIFDNLVSNSRKYAGTDLLQMGIRLNTDGKDAEIRFADNGQGVPTDRLPHIFEEFYQADDSRHDKDSHGLGLYIVSYLVDAMGGSVRAQNEGGLAVYLSLPIYNSEYENME